MMFRLPICALCGPMGRGTGMSLQGCRCHCSCAWTPKPLVPPPTCHGRHGGGRACRTVVPSCACPHCPSWNGGLPARAPPTCLPDSGEAFPGCRGPLLSPALQETRWQPPCQDLPRFALRGGASMAQSPASCSLCACTNNPRVEFPHVDSDVQFSSHNSAFLVLKNHIVMLLNILIGSRFIINKTITYTY